MKAESAPFRTESDKEAAILQAMLELIAERGFHGAPVSLLAQRSGVSAGIIYHYFDSKEAVIHELYRQVKGRYGAALIAGGVESLPWPDHIIRLWLNAYHFYAGHPLDMALIDQYENSPFVHSGGFDYMSDDNMARLASMVQADIEQGLIKPMPFEVLYELTLGVAAGLARRHIRGEIDLSHAELEGAARACCRAIQA